MPVVYVVVCRLVPCVPMCRCLPCRRGVDSGWLGLSRWVRRRCLRCYFLWLDRQRVKGKSPCLGLTRSQSVS